MSSARREHAEIRSAVVHADPLFIAGRILVGAGEADDGVACGDTIKVQFRELPIENHDLTALKIHNSHGKISRVCLKLSC